MCGHPKPSPCLPCPTLACRRGHPGHILCGTSPAAACITPLPTCAWNSFWRASCSCRYALFFCVEGERQGEGGRVRGRKAGRETAQQEAASKPTSTHNYRCRQLAAYALVAASSAASTRSSAAFSSVAPVQGGGQEGWVDAGHARVVATPRIPVRKGGTHASLHLLLHLCTVSAGMLPQKQPWQGGG